MVRESETIKADVKLRDDGWAWSLSIRKSSDYSWRFITGGNCKTRLEAYDHANREFELAKRDIS